MKPSASEQPGAMRVLSIPVLAVLCLPLAARADYASGRAAEERGDRPRALSEYVTAADSDPRAARALVRLHESGDTGAAAAQQALRWLRRAGELGDVDAQYELGWRYLNGRGAAAREPREAAIWFERAAGSGHPGAQFELGRMLTAGPVADPARGQRLIEQAADAGEPDAIAWLGRPAPDAGTALADAGPPVARKRDASARLPQYWDEREPRVTLHWGVQQGYGNWGWSLWDPYPYYPWGGPAWGWPAYGCAGGWCGPPHHHYPHSGIYFGWSIGN
jgi:TPR repeat protein